MKKFHLKMSSQADVQKSINKVINNIYPDVSETSKKGSLDAILDASNVKPIITETYTVSGIQLDSSDYKEKSNVGMWIIGIIIVIILFFIVWIIAYNYSGDLSSTDDDTNTDTHEFDTNIGAIIKDNEYYIVAAKLAKKMKHKYQLIKIGNENCNYGYYGENCNFQAHSVKYYNVGSFNSKYKSEISPGQKTLSLNYSLEDGSKDRSSCTSICDFRTDCKGVIYNHDNSTCSLITSDVIANGESSMDYTKSNQMYLKRTIQPQFTDLIVGFAGSKIMRYYLSSVNSETIKIKSIDRNKKRGTKRNLKGGIIHFLPETVTNTNWTPYRIANYGGYVGLYSQIEFTVNNWQDTEMIYVDQGVGEYNIPLFLQEYKNLYVLYISSSDYNS